MTKSHLRKDINYYEDWLARHPSDWLERWEWRDEKRDKPHLRKITGVWWCANDGDIAGSTIDAKSAYNTFKAAYARETFK